jgi:hypothetical protein
MSNFDDPGLMVFISNFAASHLGHFDWAIFISFHFTHNVPAAELRAEGPSAPAASTFLPTACGREERPG